MQTLQSNQSKDFKSVKRLISTVSVKEQTRQSSDQLDEKERKDFRRAVGQLNCVSGITRPDILFHSCDASARFKNSTVADALRVNMIIKYLKIPIVLSKYHNLIRTL